MYPPPAKIGLETSVVKLCIFILQAPFFYHDQLMLGKVMVSPDLVFCCDITKELLARNRARKCNWFSVDSMPTFGQRVLAILYHDLY